MPNFLPGPHVYAAAREALDHDSGQYGSNRGSDALLDAFIGHLDRIGLPGYTRAHCASGIGAKHILYTLAEVLLDEGDGFAFATPYWTTYLDIAEIVGADIQLRTLGGILARQKVTPHTQVALTNAAGTVFAHEDSFQLVQFGVDGRQGPELATLTSFGVPILAAVGAEVDLAQVAREGRQHQVLRQDGASWQVAVSRVAV